VAECELALVVWEDDGSLAKSRRDILGGLWDYDPAVVG
jgi:hypothetical protein